MCRSVCVAVLEGSGLGQSTCATARSDIAANCIYAQEGICLQPQVWFACQVQATSSTCYRTVLHTCGSEMHNLETVGDLGKHMSGMVHDMLRPAIRTGTL